MKRVKLCSMVASVVLLIALAVNLSGSVWAIQSTDLMEGIVPNSVTPQEDLSAGSAQVTDFALRLFRATYESGENTLISPLSLLCALAMTFNGAEGETLAQLEAAVGMTRDELNLYLYSYVYSLPQDEKNALSIANSIWLPEDDSLVVKREFLQANADYFGADVYKTAFDKTTVKDINAWVERETNGMIPELLERISPETVICLINALVFEAEWARVYQEGETRSGTFTMENGATQSVEFMTHTGYEIYLEDENAVGIVKKYSGGKYAFVALLPDEGISLSEYIQTLDGEVLSNLLSGGRSCRVFSVIPKFKSQYSTSFVDVLKGMGITDAFNPDAADFDGIGSWYGNSIYIDDIIQKTAIQVDERGTAAGAASYVGGAAGGMPVVIHEVILDRPFVYMLIDCENNVPFFIGTLNDARG